MALSEERRAELARKGAVEVNVQEWLGLSDVEAQVIELRVRLAKEVRRHREANGLTQVALAKRVGTKQPRLVKIEYGDPGVSMDRLVSAFLATGATLSDLANLVAEVAAGVPAH
jgi:DNA-binding XRE family transcriptional regulator